MAQVEIITPEQLQKALNQALKPLEKALNNLKSSSEEDVFLTVEETADLLKVSSATVRDYAKRGVLKDYRLGSKVIRFRKKEVIEAFQAINKPRL